MNHAPRMRTIQLKIILFTVFSTWTAKKSIFTERERKSYKWTGRKERDNWYFSPFISTKPAEILPAQNIQRSFKKRSLWRLSSLFQSTSNKSRLNKEKIIYILARKYTTPGSARQPGVASLNFKKKEKKRRKKKRSLVPTHLQRERKKKACILRCLRHGAFYQHND